MVLFFHSLLPIQQYQPIPPFIRVFNIFSQYITMNFKTIPLILLLLISATCIDQFKSKKEKLDCIGTCQHPITVCIKEINSACFKATNFLTCIESSNSLMMQQIGKCMRAKCKNEEKPNQEQKKIQNIEQSEQLGDESVHFRIIKNTNSNPDSDQDIQLRRNPRRPAEIDSN